MLATVGLQISQPSPRPCAARSSAKVRMRRAVTICEELLPREREVLAERRLHGSPAGLQLPLQDVADHRQAPAAAGARLRARLDLRDGREAVLADAEAHGLRGHVVARADLGVVGQRRSARRPAAAAEPELLERLGEHALRAREVEERAVRGGVADEDAADELALVAAEDELLVRSAELVVDLDDAGLRGRVEGIPEGGDVDAEELELRRLVGALEARVAAAVGSARARRPSRSRAPRGRRWCRGGARPRQSRRRRRRSCGGGRRPRRRRGHPPGAPRPARARRADGCPPTR